MNQTKALVSAALVAVAAAPLSAMAALPADVTTEFATMKTDIGTVGGLILVLAVIVAGYAWVKRMIGK